MQHQPAVNPETGAIYLAQFIGPGGVGWSLNAFHPSGPFNWLFDPSIAAGMSGPEVGPDGNIYFAWDGFRLSAVDPSGQPVWLHEDTDGSFDDGPIVSSDNSVVAITGGMSQETWWVKGISTVDGEDLWRVDLPEENSGHIITTSRPKFTADDATIYIPTNSGGYVFPTYCYLYAIDASSNPVILGDVNGDGLINLLDVQPFVNLLTSGDFQAEADVNQDGVVNLLDVAGFVDLLSGG